jgi:hypothetical protein
MAMQGPYQEARTTAPHAPDAIGHIHERLDTITIQARNITIALSRHADSILGPEPQPAGANIKPEGVPSCTRDYLSRLENQIVEITQVLSRLGLSL